MDSSPSQLNSMLQYQYSSGSPDFTMAWSDCSQSVGLDNLSRSPLSNTDLSFNNSPYGQSMNDSCQCLRSSMDLLDEVAATRSSPQQASLDKLLAFFRGSLKRLNNIIDCFECNANMGKDALLAMAANDMSLVCQQAVAGLATNEAKNLFGYEPRTEASSAAASPKSVDTSSSSQFYKKMEDMRFGVYQVEDDSEKTHIIAGLLTLQFSEFSRALDKMWARVSHQPGQATLLNEAIQRYQESRRALDASLSA